MLLYVPTEKLMSIRPVNSQCSRQLRIPDAQRVLLNSGPKCLSTGLFAFSSPQFPDRLKASSQATVGGHEGSIKVFLASKIEVNTVNLC